MEGRRLVAGVLRVVARLIGGWLAICVILSMVAIGMKLFGDLSWSTLGLWALIDAGLLALRWVLVRLGRLLQPRPMAPPS